MIITGCEEWTLYEDKDYKGESKCFQPSDTKNCYPSFYRTETNMNGWTNRVSSVRKGCFPN